MDFCEQLLRKMDSLVIFRHLLTDPVLTALRALLKASQDGNKREATKAYAAFVESIYQKGGSLSHSVAELLREDDNLYVRRKAMKQEIPPYMQNCLAYELSVFSEIAALTPDRFRGFFGSEAYLADWDEKTIDIAADYRQRTEQLSRHGYGIYAKYTSFILRDGVIVPVKYPDHISLNDLKGYENERRQVIENTRALVEGKPAQNVLLTGDAGTGKSSTVKAVANYFAPMGLRLIQITKSQLHDLPMITDELSANPLTFILFIDDLSFSGNDDDFGALKAVLEGSVSAKASNTAIYVTSNRRHLVKESFSDRDGDEVHYNDTLQEIISLSDRFGLHVTYIHPDRKAYLNIVTALADSHGILRDREELCRGAEAFATRKGGRSPRTAKQYIDRILAGEEQ